VTDMHKFIKQTVLLNYECANTWSLKVKMMS